jgi:hypothetical protein
MSIFEELAANIGITEKVYKAGLMAIRNGLFVLFRIFVVGVLSVSVVMWSSPFSLHSEIYWFIRLVSVVSAVATGVFAATAALFD